MMKKNLSVAVVIGVLLTLAVGYALFSQTINITGTATAQGNFLINAYCTPGITDNNIRTRLVSDGYTLYTESGYSNATCTPANNSAGLSVAMSVGFEYPGATKYFTTKMQNNGTIPALFNLATGFSTSEKTYCKDGLNGGTMDGTITTNTECVDLLTSGTDDYLEFEVFAFLFADSSGNLLADQDLEEYLDDPVDPTTVRLEPGMSMYVIYQARFSSLYTINGNSAGGNYGNNSFLLTITNTDQYTFNQVTAQ